MREKSPKVKDKEKFDQESQGSRSNKLPKRVINRRRSNSVGSTGSGEFNRLKEKIEKRKNSKSPKRQIKSWDTGTEPTSWEILPVEFAKVIFKLFLLSMSQ